MENVIYVSSDTREAFKPTIVPDSLLQNYNFQLENEKYNTETKMHKAGSSLHILSSPWNRTKAQYYEVKHTWMTLIPVHLQGHTSLFL